MEQWKKWTYTQMREEYLAQRGPTGGSAVAGAAWSPLGLEDALGAFYLLLIGIAFSSLVHLLLLLRVFATGRHLSLTETTLIVVTDVTDTKE